VPLTSSTRVGRYSIIAVLGAGGMGEVYRARDSHLGRDVALKVLRDDAADKPGRRARFETEARAVAALTHPNIVSIFDFGEVDGYPFAVSELIEGQSLRALLRRGRVPVRKLVDIAVQMADGLAAAHALGISHRDLKPENVMLTADGRVKILDFGLAHRAAINPDAVKAEAATVTLHITEPGTILGTPNYMSPEQARGSTVDYRSDQFSFGLILYELATGKQAFEKGSTVETLSAIVSEEPAPIEAKIPAPLRWIIDRCLAKEPQHRYESTHDLCEDLRSLREHLSDTYSSSELLGAPPRRAITFNAWRTIAIAAIAISLLAVAATVLLGTRNAGTNLAAYRYTPLAVDAKQQGSAVWSPDGKAVAYTTSLQGEDHLLVRYVASPMPTDLGIHREYVAPRGWSLNSRRIFFFAPAADSTPQNPKHGAYSISVMGGDPAFIMEMPKDDSAVGAFSPDVREAALFCRCGGKRVSVFLSSPLGTPWHAYQPDPFSTASAYNGRDLKFAPDGKKLFLDYTGEKSEPEAWILPIPPDRGRPHRVLTEVPAQSILNDASWMPDSRHLVMNIAILGGWHLWLVDTESNEARQITTGMASEFEPAVSPDGKSLAFDKFELNLNVVSASLESHEIRTLLGTERNERMAAWAGKAEELAYVTDRNGPMEVWIRSDDGSTRPAVTQDNFPGSKTQFVMNPALSPDGSRLIFTRQGPDGATRDWIISLSEGVPQRVDESSTDTEYGGAWSPDGRRFVYLQVAGGLMHLYVANVGSAEPSNALHKDVWGSLPDWSPTGEWITFQDKSGWNLVSSDGKTIKPLGKISTQYLAFSKNGKELYGIREEHGKVTLFSLDIATQKVKDIRELGLDYAPASDYGPGIRFSVAPDGKSIAYSVADMRSSLWLLEGFRQPSPWEQLFGPRNPFVSDLR